MTSNQKLLTLLLGIVSAVLIVSQLVLGELLRRGVNVRDAHRHSGHATFLVVLIYIFLTIWFIINTPNRPRKSDVQG